MTSPTGPNPTELAGASPVRGFTLLELVVLLMLLGVIVGMTTPTLMQFARSREASDSAGQILALIQYAREQAMVQGTPYRFHVDSARGAYWLTVQREDGFVRLGNDFGQTFELPEFVELTLSADGQSSNAEVDAGIELEPDGSHDTARVVVVGRNGRTVAIVCDSATEAFRITEMVAP